jgi:hypothetical protein
MIAVGTEAKCLVRSGSRKTKGIAHLEGEEIRFAGKWKLRIPFKEITALDAKDGDLHVFHAYGEAIFTLGPAAEKWVTKIRTPKGLLDKLGIKSDSRVLVQGIGDKEFLSQLQFRTPCISSRAAGGPFDFVVFGSSDMKGLAKLTGFRKKIAPQGSIWVVWPKGRPQLKEDHVRAAGKAAGLVDVKVVKFSESHSALKLVIPVAKR